MYIDSIAIRNFRTFRRARIDFMHADQDFEALGLPKPRYPNLNLLLANNGLGKTTLLRAVALAALGPAVEQSGIYPYRLIRREKGLGPLASARLEAVFTPHAQDQCPTPRLESKVELRAIVDTERLEWAHPDAKPWHPIFSSSSDAFFMVGYGATRRVSKPNRTESSSRSLPRATRVMGLFEDEYSLRPLNTWLPRYEESPRLRGRYAQVRNLINRIVGRGGWQFTGTRDNEGEYLYAQRGALVPFPALSDGYRAFLGWLGDLLFHVCETCPSGKKLVENRGLVMVDEIDLHLHPKWQMTVLQSLARELPNLQFILTSHSPLLVGCLEWMNIIVMQPGSRQSSQARRIPSAVHGLDADQVLLTDFFGLDSTRAPGKKRQLKSLSQRARQGDGEAALQILESMSKGAEALP